MINFLKYFFKPKKKTVEDIFFMNLNDTSNNITKPYTQHNVIFTAINRIAKTASGIPLVFVDGNGAPVEDYELYNLFHDSATLTEGISTFLNLKGESFIYHPQSTGQQVGIKTLPSFLQLIAPSLLKEIVDGSGVLIGWRYNDKTNLGLEEITQIKNYHPYNLYRGCSPIEASKLTLDADYSAQLFNRDFFNNSCQPDSIIMLDKEAEYDPEAMKILKKQILANHQGAGKQHLPLILQGGSEWKTLSVSQKDMDFLETRKFLRSDLLALFGVPNFVAGYDLDTINRATADAAYRLFYTSNIMPLLHKVEFTINNTILKSHKNKIKFDFSEIDCLKRSMSERVADADKLMKIGFSRDEVNKRFNLGFDDNVDNNRYYPMNLISSDDMGYSEPEKAPEKKTTKSTKSKYRRNYLLQARKNERKFKKFIISEFNYQEKKILKTLKNKSKNYKSYMDIYQEIKDLKKELDAHLTKGSIPYFTEINDGAQNMALNAVGSESVVALDMKLIKSKANKITQCNDTTFDDIRKTIYNGYNEGESIDMIGERIQKVFNTCTTSRSITIARTESCNMMSQSTFNIYKTEGVEKKQWVGGTRESHAAQDGDIIKINEVFSNGLQFPGDPSGPPEEVINCTCCISPLID